MKKLHYYYSILIACPLMLQVIWASGEPSGKIEVNPQSLPICSIGEEDSKDKNKNKYAIFEPDKMKEFSAEGAFTVVVSEPPEPHAGYDLADKKQYKWTVDGLQVENETEETCTVKSSTKQHWGKEIKVKCKVSFYERKNGQEKHLIDIEGEHKLLTPLVFVKKISFNHIKGKHDADAMDLKKTFSGQIIECPEATFDEGGNATKSDPFLYIGGKKHTLKIQAEVKPGIIENAKILTKQDEAVPTNILPEISEKGFDNNAEFEINFQDNVESKLNKGTHKWTWRLTGIQGIGLSKQTIAFETTVKNAYILFDEPLKSPWDMSIDKKKPWIKALDVAIEVAGNIGLDSKSSAEIAGNIANYTFNKMGWTYDTVSGQAQYSTRTGVIDLDSYLNQKFTSRKLVNCYDQCFSLSALVRLLGIDAKGNYQEPFGQILIVNLIGVGSCNHPFYNDSRYPEFLRKPVIYMIETYYVNRSSFGNHAYVKLNGFVYDACAGPTIGDIFTSYQTNTIEHPLGIPNVRTVFTEFK